MSTQPKCVGCGHFIPGGDIQSGKAKHHFVPLNEFGPEESDWTCARCMQLAPTQGTNPQAEAA